MATQTIEAVSTTGESPTMAIYSNGSDTLVDSAAATEATNRKGLYSASFTDLAAGDYRVFMTVGGVTRAVWFVTTTASTATFQATETPTNVNVTKWAGNAVTGDGDWENLQQEVENNGTNITGGVGVTSISGSGPAADRLEAILLADGSSDTAMASNLVSSQITGSTIADAIDGTDITIQRGSTITFTITGIGDLTGYQEIWFAAKRSEQDTTGEEIIKISKTTGLEISNGSGSVTASDASITVDDVAAGDLSITIKPAACSSWDKLTGGTWGIQWKDASDNIYEPRTGDFNVSLDIVQEIA